MFMGSVVELDYNHALLYNVVAQTMVILKYTLKHAAAFYGPPKPPNSPWQTHVRSKENADSLPNALEATFMRSGSL